MKKLLLLAVAVFALSACDDQYCDCDYAPTYMHSAKFTVDYRDWKFSEDADGLNPHWYFSFDLPELSRTVYDYGSVTGYIYTEGGQTPLQYYRVYEEWQNPTGNDVFEWTRDVTYEYSPGKVTFFVTHLKIWDEAPPTMNFRVVLTW